MKKYISRIIAMLAITLSLSIAADAQQFTIRVRPHAPVLPPRPPMPAPGHVWVSGEWTWNNGNYEYKQGYWDRPNGRHRGWREGHWAHSRRGYYWVPGGWR